MPQQPSGFRRCLLSLVLFWGGACAVPGAEPPPLPTAAAVRRLPPEEAGRKLPVRLVGTVVIVTRAREAVVLLDETDGIYVSLPPTARRGVQPGDRLEVEGITGSGDFAPMVQAVRVTRRGPGPLPAPRPTTIAELNAGGFDAAWVELEGIVRSCVPIPTRVAPATRLPGGGGEAAVAESWLANFAQGDDRLGVQINGPVAPAELVDARVRLRGVVFNVHNANRQFVRANLQVGGAAMIDVLAAPPVEPFVLPLQRIGEVLRFSPAGFSGHRVRVRGVVTGHRVGQTLWLREGDRGMRVASAQEGALRPGDEVEVVGFPEYGGYTPSLGDAIFRKVAAGTPPVPQFIADPAEIPRQDSNLVQIEAVLEDVRRAADGHVLTFGWNGVTVKGVLLQDVDDRQAADWVPGSRVRVAGLCVLGQEGFAAPTGLWVAGDAELRLRDARDLVVVRPAPWLTTRRALVLVISVAALTLVALAVVAILARRQIRQREQARHLAEVEFSAMLAERNRLAREIHDTLAQNLNAVSMQLELARNSAKLGAVEPMLPHLRSAHEIVRTCLAEARESIWNMRSHALERSDLIGALRSVAEQLRAGRPCVIDTRVEGRPRRLAPMVENHLLRIGQEAVANALKHAQAGHVGIALRFEERTVRLVVEDDGAGFDPAAAETGGRFGLRGMRERVAAMGGDLRIGRGPRGGTRVAAQVDAVA